MILPCFAPAHQGNYGDVRLISCDWFHTVPGVKEPLMSEISNTPVSEAALAQESARSDLFARLEILTQEEGHFEPVGAQHWALFEDVGTTLLVSFEKLDTLLANPETLSNGHTVARSNGWSHLCLIADGETWFRDPAVYRHFDRLVDDAFFEDFDRVLFYGCGLNGHAACAFAVTAPGAHVLAMNPRATMNPAESAWDRRNLPARRLDFTSRYGYAPDMLEGASHVVVIHDLTVREEAMHSALFRAPWVTRLSAPLLGERIERGLAHMGLLTEILQQAMAGTLSAQSYAKLWRKRRDFAPYLKALLERVEDARRKTLAIRVCRSVTKRLRAPYFSKRLAKLTGEHGR